MNRHAKASSAASTQRQATGLGRIARGAFVTRGVSGDTRGSGASSSRGRLALLGLSALALTGLVLLVASAFASKQAVDYIGGSGSQGGKFNGPLDVAVNTSGAGGVPAGTIYVADENNNRVQRFSPSGEFVSAWGANVLTASANEQQTITVNATAGTYTLSLGGATTAPLAYNASLNTVRTALRNLPPVGGAANVNLFGTPPTVQFEGSLSATNMPQLSVDDSLLTGSVTIATTTQGSGAFEVCTVAEECRAGAATGGANAANNAKNGSLNKPQSVAVDGDTGNVYVSDPRNNRVNEYSATGAFIRSFGWGVDATEAGSEYEVCPAANRCTFGSAGAGSGQIGSTGAFRTHGLAVSQPDGEAAVGTLFLADTQNRRVNTYALDGSGPSSFGSSANFGESQPRQIAVDSRGILYASDSNNGGEIDRYDTEDANGGGVGFLASIAAPPLLAGFAESATSGLEVDPDSDGAGADEDVLYVLRDPSSGNTVVQQYGPTNDPGLTAAPTAVDDTHGGEAGFTSVAGLGLDDTSGKLYVAAHFQGRVYVLDNATVPGATLDPVSGIGTHSATFSGEVNPNGTRTGYRFEYVDDATFQATGFTNAAKYPPADVDLGAGTSSIPVEAEPPHHLVPSTEYHVRLVAKNVFTANEAIGGPLTFTTAGATPSVKAVATDVEADEATLRAAIVPEGQAVSGYHFEWGPTNAYGNSTTPGALPSGAAPVAVEAGLSGLTPGQTYHYRLLATNATGTTTGPDQTFTTLAGEPQLPERGYEIASFYPTQGVPVFGLAGAIVPDEAGDSAVIRTPDPAPGTSTPNLPQNFGNLIVGTGGPQNLFVRGADRWNMHEISLPNGEGWSTNLDTHISTVATDGPGSDSLYVDSRLDPDDHDGAESTDLYIWKPDGSITWLSRDRRIPVGTPQTTRTFAEYASDVPNFTMSADGETVVFKSSSPLLDADTTSGSNSRLYKWHNGQLSFIGKRPDGSVPNGSFSAGSSLGSEGYARYAVSRDGSRVVFSAFRLDDGSRRSLYVQTDGQPTVEASKAEGVPPLSANQPFDVTYRGAAEDDSRVFFTSASRLTPDSGASGESGGGAADLYAYDVPSDTLRDLTPRLDGLGDPTVDPATADRGRALGVVANSSDGKRIYFVADAQYPTAPNPEGDLPSAGGHNLYMAELDGIDDPIELRFVVTLGSLDSGNWQLPWASGTFVYGVSNQGKTALASPDGATLGFASTESLTGQPLGLTEQLFAYDSEQGTLDCPSCPSDGSLPAETVGKYNPGLEEVRSNWQSERGVSRWVSSDGTVFFSTATALLPEDQNQTPDVYEFHDGALGMITRGSVGAKGITLFTNASVDGSSVFFTTLEALAPQDKEPGVPKAYVARVGGGFPYVAPPPPCDPSAGACEGAPSSAPDAPGAGTAAFEGPGNPKPKAKRRCPKGKRKVRRKGKVRCAPRRKHRKHKRNAKHNRRASR